MWNMDRLRRITDAVQEAGTLGVAELAVLTKASEVTIRRDLATLAEQGVLERYHGGARSLLLRGEKPPFAFRAHEGLEIKQRIAAKVAELITDGESVVIDSGTTCLEVARALRGRRLTVMPLSLQAVNALAAPVEAITLLVPGGRPRLQEGTFAGPLTRASLEALRFDTAVIGCSGLNAGHGLTVHDLDEADVKRAAIASARRVIAVGKAGKLQRSALAFVAPVTALDVLVTDASADDEEVVAIAAAGVTVQTA
uniref:DeoR/GlpR family DNA-binding transcription regulator n=1 Tax=Nonomuraea bangladeshensis TaxID=404385 RepID=UPI003F49204A